MRKIAASAVGVVMLAACSSADTPARSLASSNPVAASSRPSVDAGSPAEAAGEIDGMFDVGGHELYMYCQGTGSPTIVYMHGSIQNASDVPHANGLTILDQLDSDYRMCVYDRRNVGSSDTVNEPQSPDDAINDMRELLTAAGVEPPYVLLGASFGGLLSYLYANRYPDEVVGMVLLDAMFPDDLTLDPLLPPEERYEASSREDEATSLERISHFKVLTEAVRYIDKEPAIPVTYLASQQEPWNTLGYPAYDDVVLDVQEAYVDRFEPGTFIWLDAPHFMEAAVPDRIAQELEALIGSLPE